MKRIEECKSKMNHSKDPRTLPQRHHQSGQEPEDLDWLRELVGAGLHVLLPFVRVRIGIAAVDTWAVKFSNLLVVAFINLPPLRNMLYSPNISLGLLLVDPFLMGFESLARDSCWQVWQEKYFQLPPPFHAGKSMRRK